MSRIRLRRPTVLAALAGIGTCLATIAAPSASASTTPQAGACTIAPTGKESEAPLSCLGVTTSLDRLPAVGEQATLAVNVTVQTSVKRAGLSVQLPPALRMSGNDSGLTEATTDAFGQRTSRVLTLTPGTRTIKLKVKAVAAGPAQIQADISDIDRPDPRRAGHDSVELTIGKANGSSIKGMSVTKADTAPVQSPGPGIHPPRLVTPKAPAPGSAASGPASPRATAPAAPAAPTAQVCVSGTYRNRFQSAEGGSWNGKANRDEPVSNANITLWGKPTANSATQKLATGMTGNGDGRFNLCYTPTTSVTSKLWVEFQTQAGGMWSVVDGNGRLYSTATYSQDNVSRGISLGNVYANSGQSRAWHAFDTLNKLWWNRGSTTNCWAGSQSDGRCTPITVQWYPGSTDGTYWTTSEDKIHLADNDPDSEHTTVHEAGHALMGKLYNGWWPNVTNCSPHYVNRASSTSCGWTEGFANAVSFHTFNDTTYYWGNGSSLNLANDRTTTGIDQGDACEARVATALLDLWSQVDGGWTRSNTMMSKTWQSSFREYFLTDRPAYGLDTGAKARNVLYNHTIQY
ncbi:mycolysin [Streptomyces luteoverticillatus]|uniref:Mycolysin n=1 Tax=Streptomyces luteoverticillatus TaxID=66425 RepID=A0A3S9PRR4_STRLT|nr:mycolysin [Streptomyces luteoverticillatus]AZQ74988.1 mycolysin [Streptomyces luteoverticillatus]